MPAECLRTEQLAELIGVSPRRVFQLRNEPDPPPVNADGRYPCVEAGAWIRRKIISELGVSSTGEVYDFDAEKARLTFHQANKAALEEETIRGNLIPAEAVKQRWEEIAGNVRAHLLNLPGRLATAVNGATTQQEAEMLAREIIYEVLTELSNGEKPRSTNEKNR